MMSVSCKGVIIENLVASMQGVATLPTIIRASCNVDLPTIEGCATIPFNPYKTWFFMSFGQGPIS